MMIMEQDFKFGLLHFMEQIILMIQSQKILGQLGHQAIEVMTKLQHGGQQMIQHLKLQEFN